MPTTPNPTCPQCRSHEPDQFSLERHTVYVCGSCGYSWTGPAARAMRDATPQESIIQSRERLREALLRFLRPWVYPNSGIGASGTPAAADEDAAAQPQHHKVA